MSGGIIFLLLQNRSGVTRLSRWFVDEREVSSSERLEIQKELKFQIAIPSKTISANKRPFCFEFRKKWRVLVRQYAGLHLIMGVDLSKEPSDLGAREFLHLLVEIFDMYFGNVCELDIVYNFHVVHQLIDECIIGGRISQTTPSEVISKVKQLEQLAA